MFTHQSAEFLMIDDNALMTKFGANTPVTVSLELVADRLDAVEDSGIVEVHSRCIAEGGSGQAHQPTSLRDGDTDGNDRCRLASRPGCAFQRPL
jgi:hypothetical protein